MSKRRLKAEKGFPAWSLSGSRRREGLRAGGWLRGQEGFRKGERPWKTARAGACGERMAGFGKAALFLFPFLAWSACTEIIEVDLGSMDPVLVVDARLTTDTASHVVKLSRSCDYYDPDLAGTEVCGATVYVTETGGKRFDFVEDSLRAGWYRSRPDVFGEMGKTYRLHIEADADRDGEKELYEASGTMPYIPPIDSVRAVYGMGMPPFYMPDPSRLGWNILLYAQDPPTHDYYGFSFALNGHTYYDSITDIFCFPDMFTSGIYLKGVPIYFFADSSASGSRRVPPLKEGDTATLIVYSFSEEYNRFISDVKEAVSTDFPVFSGAPSNVRGNISNGAFGCFALYCVGRGSCIVPPRPSLPLF